METAQKNLLNEDQLLRASPSIFALTQECFQHFHDDFGLITAHLKENEFVPMARVLHKFRGRASMCGFRALAETASAMEHEALTEHRDAELRSLLDQLISIHDQTESAFRIVSEKKITLI